MNTAPAFPGSALPATDTPAADGAAAHPGADAGLFVALLAGLIAPAAPPAAAVVEADAAQPGATAAVAAVEAPAPEPKQAGTPGPVFPEARPARAAPPVARTVLGGNPGPSAPVVGATPGPAVPADAAAKSPAEMPAPLATPDITRQTADAAPRGALHPAAHPAGDAHVHRAVAGVTRRPSVFDAAQPVRFAPASGAARETAVGAHVAQASAGRAPIMQPPVNVPSNTITEPRTIALQHDAVAVTRPETPAVTAPTGPPEPTTSPPVAAPVLREGAQVTVARVTAERLPPPVRPADGPTRVVSEITDVQPEEPAPSPALSARAPAVERTMPQASSGLAGRDIDVQSKAAAAAAGGEATAPEPEPRVMPRPSSSVTPVAPDPATVVMAPDGEPGASSPAPAPSPAAGRPTAAATTPSTLAPSAPQGPPPEAQVSAPAAERPVERATEGRPAATLRPERQALAPHAPDGRSTMPTREDPAPRPADGARAPTRPVDTIAGTAPSAHIAPTHPPADGAASTRPVAHVHIPRIAELPVRDGVRHVRIEVDPPELGRCELELSVRDGTVRAVVIAERPETVAALRQAEGQVRATLAEQDVRIAQFDVRHGGGGAGQGAPREPMDRRPPQTGPRMAPAPETPPRPPAAVARGPIRRVDMVA